MRDERGGGGRERGRERGGRGERERERGGNREEREGQRGREGRERGRVRARESEREEVGIGSGSLSIARVSMRRKLSAPFSQCVASFTS